VIAGLRDWDELSVTEEEWTALYGQVVQLRGRATGSDLGSGP